MAERRLRHLRGRISDVRLFQPAKGGGGALDLPSLDPRVHHRAVTAQLDTMLQAVQARPENARDQGATRELVMIVPSPDYGLNEGALGSVHGDVRVVGTVPETGAVLLDARSAELLHLRKKLDEFAEASKAHQSSRGEEVRAHQDGVARIGQVHLATFGERRGARLAAKPPLPGSAAWFEIACAGGYRREGISASSRAQIARQLHTIGAAQTFDELESAEQLVVFARLTLAQAEALLAATDCIYEIELAAPALRDTKLQAEIKSPDLRAITVQPPPRAAPAVVLLDSGVASAHPLLKSILLSSTTGSALITSPEDTWGHGTKMSGLAAFSELGADLAGGTVRAEHWLQSSRIIERPGHGLAADENAAKWPLITRDGVHTAEKADDVDRNRVFAMAVTRSMQDPPLDALESTLWSEAVDQLAYNQGAGRLLIVAAGNAREDQWLTLATDYPDLHLTETIHQPAQAYNALTVGACTSRIDLPPGRDHAEARAVATVAGGISPFTSCGPLDKKWPIKPDILMEGGNLAISDGLLDANVGTFSGLTTSHKHVLGQPLSFLSMTSEATARAANLAARVWAVEPDLRPETVRALLVHAASWTPQMMAQFPTLHDRLRACGYGLPDEALALESAKNRATIIVEDVIPNLVAVEEPKKMPPKRRGSKPTSTEQRRYAKFFRLPVPQVRGVDDPNVELRVTLSYLAEPKRFRTQVYRGMDLSWDMQGPQESEPYFLERINKSDRPLGADGRHLNAGPGTRSFSWDVGVQARGRGTVQSDRWRGPLSNLAGDKLIAVMPVYGWWNQRKALKYLEQRFALVASVSAPGIYSAIQPLVEASVEV